MGESDLATHPPGYSCLYSELSVSLGQPQRPSAAGHPRAAPREIHAHRRDRCFGCGGPSVGPSRIANCARTPGSSRMISASLTRCLCALYHESCALATACILRCYEWVGGWHLDRRSILLLQTPAPHVDSTMSKTRPHGVLRRQGAHAHIGWAPHSCFLLLAAADALEASAQEGKRHVRREERHDQDIPAATERLEDPCLLRAKPGNGGEGAKGPADEKGDVQEADGLGGSAPSRQRLWMTRARARQAAGGRRQAAGGRRQATHARSCRRRW